MNVNLKAKKKSSPVLELRIHETCGCFVLTRAALRIGVDNGDVEIIWI